MAKTRLKNNGPAALSLPYPLRGVLAAGESVVLDGTRADLITALGGAGKIPSALVMEMAASTETADSARQGFFGGTAYRVPFINSAGTDTTTDAGLSYDASADVLTVTNTAAIANGLKVDLTDSSGTPGNATINKPAGKFAIALGASAATITNSLVAATSIVLVTKIDNDATLTDFKVVPGSGSFVVTGNATATAACKFMFFVIRTT